MLLVSDMSTTAFPVEGLLSWSSRHRQKVEQDRKKEVHHSIASPGREDGSALQSWADPAEWWWKHWKSPLFLLLQQCKHHSGGHCLLSGKKGSLYTVTPLTFISAAAWAGFGFKALQCVGQEGPEHWPLCRDGDVEWHITAQRSQAKRCSGFSKDNRFSMLSRRGHRYRRMEQDRCLLPKFTGLGLPF